MSLVSILHLEDSPLDAAVVRHRLARDGVLAQVDRVDCREDFVRALLGRSHGLILADYCLPSFDGLEALDLAREHAPDAPFLFVSGEMGEEVAIETLKRGATDYVLKHRLERLGPAVNRALAEARERADRRKAEADLRDSEGRHRLILDSVLDYAILTMDTAGRITGSNAGAHAVLGYREEELLGREVSLIYTPEDIRDGIPGRELARAGARGGGDDDRWHVRKDGTRFWGSGLVMPLLDEVGTLQGFTKVVRDVTDRKLAEQAARDADRRKDEFLAMLAHELRNPLSAIQNAAELSRRPGLAAPKLEWAQGVIVHQVRHLAHLVDDLLDVSRITRGEIRLRSELAELTEVIHRAVEAARPAIEWRGHRLTLNIDPPPLGFFGDAVRLEQVFVNLLANAAKYTDPGGRIMLRAGPDGSGELVVSVQDDGVGLAPEMVGRVFDLFAQVDNSLDRTQGGLGIGLTIARSLVELHGGTIRAESRGPGLGSTFTVRLPEVAATSPTVDAEGHNGDRMAAPGSRVLIVDDNIASAGALAGLLELSGFDVREAHDGLEALDAALAYRPEAILLDIGLPGMDGYQVAEALRREAGLRGTKIIAVTGYGEEKSILRGRQAGFDHHLVKPVDFEALLELLLR